MSPAMAWELELGIDAPDAGEYLCAVQACRIRDDDAGTASVPMEMPYQGKIWIRDVKSRLKAR